MEATKVEQLSASECVPLLGNGGVGVLSFASPDSETPPHAIPVSYGFDPVEAICYFRLAVGPESAKGEVDGSTVSFVTHGTENGDHWSVVAKGTLVRTDETAVATDSLEGLERARIPLVDVFDAPLDEIEFAFVRLDPDDLTGRRVT